MLFGVKSEPCLHDPTQSCEYEEPDEPPVVPWYKRPLVVIPYAFALLVAGGFGYLLYKDRK